MATPLPQAIAVALDRGATLLTPTQRAARAIRHTYDLQQQASGLRLWTPANVLPLETWLAAEWHRRLLEGCDSRILLNRTQEHSLWREIIQTDADTPRLRSPDALADLAARAWSLLQLHDARARLRDYTLSTDNRAFERWSHTFERRLQRGQFITASELPLALANNPQPASLALVDFDHLPPATNRLMQLLQTESVASGNSSAHAYEHIAEDDKSELQTIATWIRGCLDQDPQASIAVVVPNLAERRASMDRIFGPLLTPEALPINAPAGTTLYEFSLGRPLAELPLVKTALDLLTWLLEALSVERISALLLSPWLSPASHTDVAGFDAFELRRLSLLRPELSLDRTLELLERSARSKALEPLVNHLRALQRSARATQFSPRPAPAEPLRQPYATWADAIRTLLDAVQWTRSAARTSVTFQQHRRWESALDELATLDALASPQLPSAIEALAQLTGILRQTIFAPESHNASIQILGPLELGGVPFDALWFLSADDLSWPQIPSANPLLPWQLQRALAMPGADRARDDAAAQALTQRIAHSAATAVFSYARLSDEGDRRPSPLLGLLKASPFSAPAQVPAQPVQPLLSLPEITTLPQLPARITRGGSRILQLQAACAFRAFAETRLHSTEPETRTDGLNLLERGSLVHQVMEAFWKSIDSQHALQALPAAGRAALLDQAITSAIADLKSRPETTWDEAYLAIQHRRLHSVLDPWLATELGRSSFTVLPPEEPHTFQLGPLTLALRIDRVDLTPAGHIILDYKTGDSSPTGWDGERPDEPQLPLYAVLADELGRRLAGLAFALLRPGVGMRLKGLTLDPALLPDCTLVDAENFAEQVQNWRENLTSLAFAYADGETQVEPKSYPETCERCQQRILCRLDPTTLREEQVSDDEGESARA